MNEGAVDDISLELFYKPHTLILLAHKVNLTLRRRALACRGPVFNASRRVIVFPDPVNAPGMGRFKLFDLVGYS